MCLLLPWLTGDQDHGHGVRHPPLHSSHLCPPFPNYPDRCWHIALQQLEQTRVTHFPLHLHFLSALVTRCATTSPGLPFAASQGHPTPLGPKQVKNLFAVSTVCPNSFSPSCYHQECSLLFHSPHISTSLMTYLEFINHSKSACSAFETTRTPLPPKVAFHHD